MTGFLNAIANMAAWPSIGSHSQQTQRSGQILDVFSVFPPSNYFIQVDLSFFTGHDECFSIRQV
jgi:hypothetical protein